MYFFSRFCSTIMPVNVKFDYHFWGNHFRIIWSKKGYVFSLIVCLRQMKTV
ncbi:hypothetical protein HMPREF1870_00876 [Bacteroidales bacterium KA00344]|nr:hypothetical protein HMPREF1870_00876 [Bacteroidales bacterium KA00344]